MGFDVVVLDDDGRIETVLGLPRQGAHGLIGLGPWSEQGSGCGPVDPDHGADHPGGDEQEQHADGGGARSGRACRGYSFAELGAAVAPPVVESLHGRNGRQNQ